MDSESVVEYFWKVEPQRVIVLYTKPIHYLAVS